MNVELEMLMARRTLCGKDWAGVGKRPINDPFSRLYWLVSGEAFVTHHERTYHLRPGSLYLIPGHSTCYYQCPERMDLLWCHFTAKVFAGMDVFEMYPCDYEVDVPQAECKTVQQAWLRLVELFDQPGFAARFEADSLLRIFVSRFLRTIDTEAEASRRGAYERLRPALEHIEKNLDAAITLDQLGRLMNLQSTYFSNLFAKHIGMPPKKYILWRRVKEAQSLLRSTSLPIKEIAGRLGFGNEFYFSRAFSRLAGVPPTAYRARAEIE